MQSVPPAPQDRTPSLLSTRWTRIGALEGTDAEVAWQWFVARYRQFVRGILRCMLGRSALVQSAEEEFWGYVYLSGALQRANRERRFRAFLSGIVRNFARSFVRNRGLQTLDCAELEAAPSDGSASTELSMWVDNVMANALGALREESPSAANAIAMFYGIGFDGSLAPPQSAGSVAEAMGNTPQAIYMLLFRGRRRLRQLVEQELREGCSDDEAWSDELQQLLGVAASKVAGMIDR